MLPVGYDPAIFGDAESFIRSRAASLLNIGDPRDFAWSFEDFFGTLGTTNTALGWQETNAGTAGSAMQSLSDEGGGVQQLTTGATAASRASRFANGPAVANANTKQWYCAHRSKMSAVTAQSKLYGGIYEVAIGGNAITAGFHGSLNPTNFVAQYDGSESGSVVNLGVVADLNYHVFELWGLGDGRLHCAIDYGADLGNVALNAGFMLTSACGRREAVNGTDAVARTHRYDWFAVLCRRS